MAEKRLTMNFANGARHSCRFSVVTKLVNTHGRGGVWAGVIGERFIGSE